MKLHRQNSRQHKSASYDRAAARPAKLELEIEQAERRGLFTKVFEALQNANARYVVVYGSAASSKSFSVHQNELLRILKEEEGDTLFLRKYATDHRESCYKLLNWLIEDYGLNDVFKCAYSGSNRRITYLPTGRSMVFRGLDNTEKIKSIYGFKRVIIEEANQLCFNDFKEVIRRARGFDDIQFILILNPVSENHWIKKHLCDKEGAYFPKTDVFKFNYHDNRNADGEMFITAEDIDVLERLKLVDENQYRIYALGEWGVDDRNKKFIWSFDTNLHVKPTAYEPDQPLWASFDFNVNPLTCTLFQWHIRERYVRVIECFKLPNSDIWRMCERLKAAYPNAIWRITGDATGAHRQAISRDNLNYYHVIMNELNLAMQQMIVPNVNPPIEENQLTVNAVFRLWTVEIDPHKCQPLIYDLTYVEIDEEKKIRKDRSSEKTCADFLDTFRYFVNAALKEHLGLRR